MANRQNRTDSGPARKPQLSSDPLAPDFSTTAANQPPRTSGRFAKNALFAGFLSRNGNSVIRVHSSLSGPIDQLSMLNRSLLFAELSAVAYSDEPEAREICARIGFDRTDFLNRDGAQAYVLHNAWDCVVTCRGTEPDEWNDIIADVNAFSVVTETFGRVHKGFKQEADDLWPVLELMLRRNDKTLWFTGHSLGAAISTICAGRCFLSEIASVPHALFTFGSPRVGDRRFVNLVNLEHFRWVNNNDLVARVPPAWLGYRHGGEEMYLNHRGQLRRLEGWRRIIDRLWGILRGMARFRIDQFADHGISRYVDNIRRASGTTVQAQKRKDARQQSRRAA